MGVSWGCDIVGVKDYTFVTDVMFELVGKRFR